MRLLLRKVLPERLIQFLITHIWFLCGLVFIGLLFYIGFPKNTLYGIIDHRFPELEHGSALNRLYAWGDFRAFGEIQTVRFSQVVEDVAMKAFRMLSSDIYTLNFLKYFLLNIGYYIVTYFTLLSFKPFIVREYKAFKKGENIAAVLALFSVFNLYYLQSNQIATFLQRYDYIVFCLLLLAINRVVFLGKGKVLLFLSVFLSLGVWNLFPYWIPCILVLFTYSLFLLYRKYITFNEFFIGWVFYTLVNIPAIFGIVFYLKFVELGDQVAYSKEVLVTANQNSTVQNTLAFIGGANWGLNWGHVANPVFQYADEFVKQPFHIVLKYVPILLFGASLLIKRRTSFVYWLLFLVLLLAFMISSINPPFGDLFQKGFDNLTLFKVYRESHNKIYPVFIFLISLIVYFQLAGRSFFSNKKYSILRIFIAFGFLFYFTGFSTVIFKHTYYSPEGFFKLPVEYQEVSSLIPPDSIVLTIPEPGILKSYEYGHFGTSPLMHSLPNPGLFVYNILEDKTNTAEVRKILAEFNVKKGASVYQQGSNEPLYRTSILDRTNINFIIIDTNVIGLPLISREELQTLLDNLINSGEFTLKQQVGKLFILEKKQKVPLLSIEGDPSVSLSYSKVSPVQYDVTVSGATKGFQLNFLQTFNKGWVLLEDKSDEVKNCSLIRTYPVYNVSSCAVEDGSFFKQFLLFFADKVSVQNHSQVFDYANRFKVSNDEMVEQMQNDKTGQGKIKFHVYFYPQLYMLITYLITLISAIAFAVVLFIHKPKRHE